MADLRSWRLRVCRPYLAEPSGGRVGFGWHKWRLGPGVCRQATVIQTAAHCLSLLYCDEPRFQNPQPGPAKQRCERALRCAASNAGFGTGRGSCRPRWRKQGATLPCSQPLSPAVVPGRIILLGTENPTVGVKNAVCPRCPQCPQDFPTLYLTIFETDTIYLTVIPHAMNNGDLLGTLGTTSTNGLHGVGKAVFCPQGHWGHAGDNQGQPVSNNPLILTRA
jgi:hypothetical protein